LFLGLLTFFGVVLVPGFSAWTKSLAPPWLPGEAFGGLLTAATGALVYVISTFRSENRIRLLTLGNLLIFFSLLVLLPIYLGCLNAWTVLEPQSGKVRFQVGFGTEDWSLEPKGLDIKAELGSRERNIMMRGTGFQPGGPESIWKSWTIGVAGGVLIILYFSCFLMWTAGFKCLARHEELSEGSHSLRKSSPRQLSERIPL
jgi:hypothetical protein